MSKYKLKGNPLELRPFKGETLTDVLGYLKRDLSRSFSDLFAILARDNRFETGQYAPAISAEDNLDDVTFPLGPANFVRTLDMVTVFGVLQLDATATGDYSFQMSLPIPSNLQGLSDLAGSAGFQGAHVLLIRAEADTDSAEFLGNAGTTSNSNASFIFSYRLR